MSDIRLIYKNEKGMVLPLGLMFLAIIAILGTTAVIVTTTDLKIGSNYRDNVQAFYIAEAGLARAKAELINDLKNDQDFSNGSYVTTSGTIALPYNDVNFDNNLFSNIPFGEGFYTIQLKNYPTSPENKSTIWVKSIGTGPNSSTVTLESYLSAENISPWNNAMFSGGGAGAVPITGNVVIAGSIHILGDGLLATDTVFSNQTGDCRNTNVGMDPALANAIAGGTSSDLNAKFRIKNGQVDMSVGSADIGSSSSPFKGIYVTDGDDGDGNGVNDDIIGGDNVGAGQNLYAGKGATSAKAYDLGDDIITLPSINDAELTPISLDLTEISDLTGGPPNNGNSLTEDGNPGAEKGLINGALELTESISWNPPGPGGPQDYFPDIEQHDGAGGWASATNGIRFDGDNKVLEIKGIVKVTTLNISEDITYAGSGTIYVTGTTLINGDVLPKAGETYPTTTDAFGVTTKNVFGVVSTGDLTLPSTAKKNLTGAYYTEGTATCAKSDELAGTIVCKNFNITANVPKIWQVPSLSANLPPGMPGSGAVWVFTDRTWREITE